jgi:hypothetical protein
MSTIESPHLAVSPDPALAERAHLQHLVAERLVEIADDVRKAVSGADHHLASGARAVERARTSAQAMFTLLRGGLPKRERRAIKQALRDVRSNLAPLARELAAASQVPLDADERAIAIAVIETAVAPSHDELRQLLADGATQVAASADALRSILPETFDWNHLVAGATSLYRDARRWRRAAKRSKRAFRRWARRTSQLVDVLELAHKAGAQVAELGELTAARELQHPVIELIEVRSFMRDHEEHVEHFKLVAALNAQLAPARADVRRAAREAFSRRPRQLARDLAPARDQAQPVD